MKLSSAMLIDMAAGMNRLPLGPEDANPDLVPSIFPVVDTLIRGSCVNPSSSLTVESSFYGSSSVNIAASSIATNVVMLNLDKGIYTIDLELSARFVGTVPAPNGAHDLNFSMVQNGVVFSLCGLFHIIGAAAHIGRRFRLCVSDTVFALRRVTAATGVGQTMEGVFSVAVERNL